jgi:hypothetical protein
VRHKRNKKDNGLFILYLQLSNSEHLQFFFANLHISKIKLALVAHTYNPSNPEGRDQEDYCLKPAQANTLQDTISEKKPSQKIGLAEWLKVKALSSSPNTTKKKKCFCWVRRLTPVNPPTQEAEIGRTEILGQNKIKPVRPHLNK